MTCSQKLLLLLSLVAWSTSLPAPTTQTQTTSSRPQSKSDASSLNFHPDCADPHNEEIACTVHRVDCDLNLFPLVEAGNEPPDPHDLRIEAFAKVGAKGANKHQLHVDVSWQMPPKNESTNLRAFKLKIKNFADKSKEPICFAFNVSHFDLNQDSASPRFHFTSESLFDFDQEYTVTLFSYPFSKVNRPHTSKQQTMPGDPDNSTNDPEDIEKYCKTHSDPEAFAWTAGFRKIFLQSIARTIQIEFVGAPPKFCFEEYELRLLDETGIDLLHHTIIKASDMKKELINGKVVTFGEFNFTDLELDVDYIPSVLPVETATDGRCLCPTSEQHGACSCTSADWKKVRLHKIEKQTVPRNYSVPEIELRQRDNVYSNTIFTGLLLIAIILVVACAAGYLMVCLCKKYKHSAKNMQIRYITGSSNGAVVTSEPRAPLITNTTTSVLIVYAHDCPHHEAAVAAFAELLRDVFNFQVHMDIYDLEDIESNLAEYVNGSIVRADKVIVINSVGAFYRARARHMKEDVIARIDASPLDSLFNAQIDYALQHARVVSVRFSYTPFSHVIQALFPLLQYSIPDNLGGLIAALNDNGAKTDPRLSGFTPELSKLNAAVSRMARFIESEPAWFEKRHHRLVPVPPVVVPEVTHISPRRSVRNSPVHGVAVVATTPMSEVQPLIADETEEAECSIVAAVVNAETIPDEPTESGFYSGPISGQTSGLVSGNQDDSAVQVVQEEIPLKDRRKSVEPKDPRHAEDQQDSVLVSDYISVSVSS